MREQKTEVCVCLVSPNLVTDEGQSLRTLMTESSEVICSPTELSKLANKIRNVTKMATGMYCIQTGCEKKSASCLSKSAFPQEIKQQSHQRVWPELLQK